MPLRVGVAPRAAPAKRAPRTLPRPYSYFVAAGAIFAAAAPAPAQMALRNTVIKNVTVLRPGEAPIEKATLVISGDKLVGVGPNSSPGMLPREVKVRGKYVTPGFVDCWGMIPGESRITVDERADGSAIDGVDRFNKPALQSLWSQGIVVSYVAGRAARGFGGSGSVLHLEPPGGDEDPLWVKDAAAHFNTAALGDSPIRRIQTLQGLQTALKDAKEYGEALEDYEDELKEYTDKLAEKAKKTAAGEKAEAGKPGDKPASGEKPAGKAEAKPGSKDAAKPATSGSTSSTSASAKKKKKKPAAGAPQPPGDTDKKKDALKKPTEPTRDPRKEALLKVVNGEMPLRAAASHPEDIEVLLDIAAEFNLALVLEGAHGAGVIQKTLKDAGVPVVLDGAAPSLYFVDGPRRYLRADLAQRLRSVDTPVYFGTGVMSPDYPAAGAFALSASAAMPALDDAALLKSLTIDAAAWLGCEKKYGALATGDRADFVVWTAPPFAPGATVDRVFIDGKEVYRAPEAGGAD